ncbi:hypothetical protein [Acidithrix sp. C25]|nr:hypothetical protein [Acidithrix sp. C25]CAG4931742.1 unnamed protein product [Acidithrix sp. C25]
MVTTTAKLGSFHSNQYHFSGRDGSAEVDRRANIDGFILGA